MGVNGSRRNEPRRAWYPSGPWIDGVRQHEAPSEPIPKARKPKQPSGNPDPNNYRLLRAQEFPGYLLVLIQYPDCKNYEGKKILLFEGLTLVDLVNQKQIDPHFFPKQGEIHSPIARFVPTDEGWDMAMLLVVSLNERKRYAKE